MGPIVISPISSLILVSCVFFLFFFINFFCVCQFSKKHLLVSLAFFSTVLPFQFYWFMFLSLLSPSFCFIWVYFAFCIQFWSLFWVLYNLCITYHSLVILSFYMFECSLEILSLFHYLSSLICNINELNIFFHIFRYTSDIQCFLQISNIS